MPVCMKTFVLSTCDSHAGESNCESREAPTRFLDFVRENSFHLYAWTCAFTSECNINEANREILREIFSWTSRDNVDTKYTNRL